MCAMTAAPGPAGGRVWEVMSRGRGHAWGARRRRALMLAIPRNSESPSADLKPPTVQVTSYYSGRGYDPVIAVVSF